MKKTTKKIKKQKSICVVSPVARSLLLFLLLLLLSISSEYSNNTYFIQLISQLIRINYRNTMFVRYFARAFPI